MGQGEILEFLEVQYKIDSKRYFTEREISKGLGIVSSSCSTSLRSLRKHNEVDYYRGYHSSFGGKGPYYYRYKEVRDF